MKTKETVSSIRVAPLAAFDNDEAWFSDFSLPALKSEMKALTLKTKSKYQNLLTMEDKECRKPTENANFKNNDCNSNWYIN